MNFQYEKRANGSRCYVQSFHFIMDLFPAYVAFTDASVKSNRKNRCVSARLAIFELRTCGFQVVNHSAVVGKNNRLAVDQAEIAAIKLAAKNFPGYKILSDSKTAVGYCQERGFNTEWIPRELNGFANSLAKNSSLSSGYIAFNKDHPSEGWIDFVVEE